MADVLNKTQQEEEVLIEELGYDDEFHEHHHGDKYQSNFITTYIFSQDHKIIARQFLITGMIWAIIGGLMSLVFRLQLGFPAENISWLKPFLGKWIQVSGEGVGTLDPQFYYALVTMHGTILVFFCANSWLEWNIFELAYSIAIRC